MSQLPVFRHYLKGVRLILLLVLIFSAAPFTHAQTETPTATSSPTSAPQPTAVQPNSVSNIVDTELVVTGNNFVNGAVVVLEGYGALATTTVSPNLLRALLPAYAPARVYTVTIVNPDAQAASLVNGLRVTEPPATPGASAIPNPTNTPPATAFVRPLLIVDNYGASSAQITPGSNFDFEMTVANAGQITASNIVATFVSGSFIPRNTGGVRALGSLQPGEKARFWQPLAASTELAGQAIGTLNVKIDYTDSSGTAYSETFALTFPIVPQAVGGAASATPTPTATPTATAAPRLRPQLIITNYTIDVPVLEPGTIFDLALAVQNQGSADARRVTMIVGGGSSSGGVNADGTPEAGGMAGASGSFTEFAPVGTSNVQALGDLLRGQSLETSQALIVNATTKPGAYPLKVSFVYSDDQNGRYVDDQVITLLVYKRPSVSFNFYAPEPPIFAGEPASLPLQVINTGSSSSILGTFKVTAEGATLENNSVFVGALEPGGFFPLDALLITDQTGPLDLHLSVDYTDDFNQPQVLTDTLTVEVMEGMVMEETEMPLDGFDETATEPEPETWGAKIWRFILGLLGLSSGVPVPEQPLEPMPSDFGAPEGIVPESPAIEIGPKG